MPAARQSSIHDSNRTGGIIASGTLPLFPHKILLVLNLCINTSYNINTKYMMTGLYANEYVYLLAVRAFNLLYTCYKMKGNWRELWLCVNSTSCVNYITSFVIFTCRLIIDGVFVWSFRYLGIGAVFIIINCGVIFQCAADAFLTRSHMTYSVWYTFVVILISAVTFQVNAFNLTPGSYDDRVSYVIACTMCMVGQVISVVLNIVNNYTRDSNPFSSQEFPAVLWDTIILSGMIFVRWDESVITSVSSVYFIASVISCIAQKGIKGRLCMSVPTYITDTIEMAGYIILYPTLLLLRIETLSGVSVCCFFIMLISMYHYGLVCQKYEFAVTQKPTPPVSTTSHTAVPIIPGLCINT
jgi:hypothetical protein